MDGAATAAPPGAATASRIRPFLLAGDPVTTGSPADVVDHSQLHFFDPETGAAL